ncbi:hypothetical protein [Mediterraneibacter glycyrrhizinilyticus]|nr:hypothetical protein [Mediterraneibacter glycyrrhizinilyticus]
MFILNLTRRTNEKIREGTDPFTVWKGFYDNLKREEYDLRGSQT